MDDAARQQPKAGGRAAGRHPIYTDQRGPKQHPQRPFSQSHHCSDHRVVVSVQHRCTPPQQIPPQHPRLPLPHFPDSLPYGILCTLQHVSHPLAGARTVPAHRLPSPIPQNRCPKRNLLFFGGLREHLVTLPPRLLQPGNRSHDPLFHCHFRLHHHLQEGICGGVPRFSAGGVRNRSRQQQRAPFPPLRLFRLRRIDGRPRLEIGGAGDRANVGGGEAAFDESAPVHGAHGCPDFAAVYALYRRECGRDYDEESKGGSLHLVLACWECDGGIFGKFDEFPRDEAHQRPDAAGVRECEGGRRGGGIGADFPESGVADGDDRFRCHYHGRCALQRSKEEIALAAASSFSFPFLFIEDGRF